METCKRLKILSDIEGLRLKSKGDGAGVEYIRTTCDGMTVEVPRDAGRWVSLGQTLNGEVSVLTGHLGWRGLHEGYWL